MKRCPKCKKEWPVDGNFCPLDGATLETIKVDPPPEPEQQAAEDPDAALSETLGDVGWEDEDAPKPKKKNKKGKREFSETQWFMVGENPEELEDVKDVGELQVVSEKYDRDSTIPDNVRSQFTLREKNKKGGD